MATESDHIACANRTQQTIVHLLADPATHSPWIATAAFYKAVHVVEAVFANDKSVAHTSNHGEREQALKRQRKYDHICRNFLPLCRASTNARYLLSCRCFDDYLRPEDVIAVLLKHHLHQVEKSALNFLGKPAELVSILAAFGPPRT